MTLGHIKLKYKLVVDCDIPAHTENEVHINDSVIEDMYVTLGTPNGTMTTVWTDLLEYSCLWAINRTTAADVVSDCTDGLHSDSPWTYDPASAHFFGSYYNLRGALNPSPSTMDCRDVSGLNWIALHSQGISSSMVRVADDLGLDFDTNLLCPMGSDPASLINYASTWFACHQYVEFNSQVFDASNAQRYSLSGTNYLRPPKGWSHSGHWQTADGSGGFWGLAESYKGSSSGVVGTSYPSVPFILGVK